MRIGRSALAFVVAACLGSSPRRAAPQDVRFSAYHGGIEWAGCFVDNAAMLRPVWGSAYEFCPVDSDTLMRELDLAGRPLGPDVQMTQACGTSLVRAAAVLPSGKFVLVGGTNYDIWARIFDSAGAPITGDVLVRDGVLTTTQGLDVAPAGPTSFAVVWDVTNTGELMGRTVNDDGTMGPELKLEQVTPGNGSGPRIVAFGTGEMLIVWLFGMTSPPRADLLGRLYDGTLLPLGPSFKINQMQVQLGGPALSAQGSRALVVWERDIAANGDVAGRWLDEAAGPLGNEVVLNTYTADGQGWPDPAFDAQGRAVVTWYSYGQDGGSGGVYGQRFDSQGNPWGPEFRVNMTTWNPQGTPRVTVLPGGDFAVMFGSMTGDNLDDDVLMRRFFFPVSLTLGPGPGPTNTPRASILRPDGRLGYPAIAPYPGASGHGATVGAGDIDGGLDEILTGPGPSPSYGPQVRAFKSDGAAIQKVNFYAYGTLKYGVKEGTAALDGDAYREILTTPGPGAVFGPHVRGFNFDGATLTPIAKVSFFAFNTLRYGCNASRAELDGDGYDEMLVTPGPGSVFGAQLRAFDYDNTTVTPIGKVNAYVFAGTSFGATVAAADIDSDGIGGYLDGYDEIVVGKGPSSVNDSELRVFDYGSAGLTLAQRSAQTSPLPYASMYGLNVAGGDVDAGDTQEIATAPGPDPAAAARILCWEWNPHLGWPSATASLQTIGTDDFTAFAGMGFGANVAIGRFE